MPSFVFLLGALCSASAYVPPQPKHKYCLRSDSSCWPTPADVQDLRVRMDPSAKRILKYNGHVGLPHPFATLPAPVPAGAEQPLFGFGVNGMAPVITTTDDKPTGPCFVGKATDEKRPTCLAATRDNPSRWGPAFVAFPLTASHVVAAVKFARKHNLCVSVLGTGHDFLNRHDGCPDGFLIRTTLMKQIDWDTKDARGFGWKDGNARFGSGLTFSEIAHSASENNRIVASGWTHSVGVAGWSTGGGHGPYAGWAGLGVDNVLEFELVTAGGDLIEANATHNSDLYWAMRGGGGSTWGVMTALTLRAHAVPKGGFHQRIATWIGDSCSRGKQHLHQLIDAYLAWTLTLDKKWNGLVWMLPTANSKKLTCGAEWVFLQTYVIPGTLEESQPVWDQFISSVQKRPATNNGSHYTREDRWKAPVHIPIQVGAGAMAPRNNSDPTKETLGGVPSVLVGREMTGNGQLGAVLKERLADCNGLAPEGVGSECENIQIYHDITGNLGAEHDRPDLSAVSISPSFRTALFHIISSSGGWSQKKFDAYYSVGNNSYFGESAIEMDGSRPSTDFKERYWGGHYDKLLQVKQKYDPDNFLWCRNCVGSDL